MSRVPSADILKMVCERLSVGDDEQARDVARNELPLPAINRNRRAYTPLDLTRTALRDGFIDRYTGTRLVFPGTLRLLSVLLPEELPFHPNWAYDKCHPMYWDLYPTLDHMFPIARGGADSEENWVITSQRMNSAKAHWTLDELKWRLVPPGMIEDWDGLMSWFIAYTAERPQLMMQHKALRDWRLVALKAGAVS